jgi:catalase
MGLLDPLPRDILVRAFQYWKNIDADLGKAIEEGVRSQQATTTGTTSQTVTTPGDEAAKV